MIRKRNSTRFGMTAAAGLLCLLVGPARAGFVYVGVNDGGPDDQDGVVNGVIVVNGVVIGNVTITGVATSASIPATNVSGAIHRITVTNQTITAGANGASVLNQFWAKDDYSLPIGTGRLLVKLDGFFTSAAGGNLTPGDRVGAVNVSNASFLPDQVSVAYNVPAGAGAIQAFSVMNVIPAENDFPGSGIHEAYFSYRLGPNESVTLPGSGIYELESIPEPGSMTLLTLGICGLIGYARRARRRAG